MAESEGIRGIIRKVIEESDDPNKDITLEALLLLITTERLKHIQKQTRNEFEELKARQDQVGLLHKLQKKINASTNKKGEFNTRDDEEFKELLEKAKELGVDVPKGKTKFNSDDRDRLIENIRMTVEDLNVQNDMQLQTITRLTNERYESYQMARSILKPLHDDKINKARAIAGR